MVAMSYAVRRLDSMRTPRRIILFGAILLSGGNLLIPRIPLALFVLTVGMIAFGISISQVNKRKSLIYFWLFLVMALSFVRLQEFDAIANITRLINFMIGLLLLKIYWNENRANLTDDLLFLLIPMAYQSVGTFALSQFFPGLFLHISTSSQEFYSFIGIFNYVDELSGQTGIRRTIGFFWEPGIFQIYLNILLFLLFSTKASWRRVVLTVIAVIATSSTTGIVITALQMVYFTLAPLFQRGGSSRNIGMIVVILALAIIFYERAGLNVTEKISGSTAGSSIARMYDFNTSVEIVKEHPFNGIGFSEQSYLKYSREKMLDVSMLSRQDVDGRYNTNGLMIVLYTIGVPLGIIYIFGLLRQKIFSHRIVFAGILFISLATEPIAFTPVFVFFAFSGLALNQRSGYYSGSDYARA